MGEILNINEIIKIIPVLLEYLVPGYIFLTIRSFSFTKDYSEDKHMILKSVVLSFIFLQTIYPIVGYILNYTKLLQDSKPYIFIGVVFIISVLYIRFDLEKYIVRILGNGKTTKGDCFDVIIEDKNGTGAIVMTYLESESLIYTGSLVYYDDKFSGDSRRMVLAGYTLHTFDGDEISNFEGNKNSIVVLQMKDIKRIEIFK